VILDANFYTCNGVVDHYSVLLQVKVIEKLGMHNFVARPQALILMCLLVQPSYTRVKAQDTPFCGYQSSNGMLQDSEFKC
jgi:hypothetical protein